MGFDNFGPPLLEAWMAVVKITWNSSGKFTEFEEITRIGKGKTIEGFENKDRKF